LLRYKHSYKPLVIFTDQTGQEIEYVPNFSSNPPAYDIGEEVVVFYNPQTPQHAMLGGLALYLLPVIFAIVGGAFAILKLGTKNFDKLRRCLQMTGQESRAVYVESATLETQKILELKDVVAEKIPYFSLVLVGT